MTKLKEELSKEHFRVAIFGSARIGKDDPSYKLVFNYVTKNCDEAFSIIQEAYRSFREGGKDFCHNYHMYKLKE